MNLSHLRISPREFSSLSLNWQLNPSVQDLYKTDVLSRTIDWESTHSLRSKGSNQYQIRSRKIDQFSWRTIKTKIYQQRKWKHFLWSNSPLRIDCHFVNATRRRTFLACFGVVQFRSPCRVEKWIGCVDRRQQYVFIRNSVSAFLHVDLSQRIDLRVISPPTPYTTAFTEMHVESHLTVDCALF